MHRSASGQANMLHETLIFNQSHTTNEQLPHSLPLPVGEVEGVSGRNSAYPLAFGLIPVFPLNI